MAENPAPPITVEPPKPFVLLVVGGSPKYNWYETFKGCTVLGRPVQVEMAHWDGDCICSLSASPYAIVGTSMATTRTVTPDFLLIRSACRGVIVALKNNHTIVFAGQDWRNILYGFAHARIPSINSIDSYLACQEKPIVMGRLNEIRARLGPDAFPLIDQSYYSSWKTMTFASSFPLVAKVGTAHAGFGKMRIRDLHDLEDFRSVCALQSNYVVAEPFVEWDYDFRLQKIGLKYRAFRRFSDNWKGKGMSQRDEDIELTPRMKLWIDEAAAALGMDICALDGVHSKKDGKEYILELNDSAIGFNGRYYEQDMKDVRDLVLQRMMQSEEQRGRNLAVKKVGTAIATQVAKEKTTEELKDEIAMLKAQLEQANGRAAKAEAVNAKKQALESSNKGGISKFFGI